MLPLSFMSAIWWCPRSQICLYISKSFDMLLCGSTPMGNPSELVMVYFLISIKDAVGNFCLPLLAARVIQTVLKHAY